MLAKYLDGILRHRAPHDDLFCFSVAAGQIAFKKKKTDKTLKRIIKNDTTKRFSRASSKGRGLISFERHLASVCLYASVNICVCGCFFFFKQTNRLNRAWITQPKSTPACGQLSACLANHAQAYL